MNKKQCNLVLTLSIIVSIILIIQIDFLFISQSKRVILGLIINGAVTLCFWALYIYSRKIYDPTKDPLIKNISLSNVELVNFKKIDEKELGKILEEMNDSSTNRLDEEYKIRITSDNYFAITFHKNLIGEIKIEKQNIDVYEIKVFISSSYQKEYFDEVIKGLKEYLFHRKAKKVVADIYLKGTKDYYLSNGFVDIENQQDRMECVLEC